MHAACSTCTLERLCLCARFSRHDERRLLENARLARPLLAGEHVFRAGDPFDSVFAVRSGWLKTFARRLDGEERVIGFQLPGDLLGLDAIDSGTHPLHAVALTDTRICRIPFATISRMTETNPELQLGLLRLMSRDLACCDRWLVSDKLSADCRVAGFLVDLIDRREQRGLDARSFRLPMSRADIGSFLNLANETVSRTLTGFQKNQLIDVERRMIRILQPGELRQLLIPLGAIRAS